MDSPTLEYIEKLRRRLERRYIDDDRRIKRIRAVRTLEQPVPLDKDYRLNNVEVRDPTVNTEIVRVAGALSLNPPKCHVVPSGVGDLADENATLRERFSMETLKVAGSYVEGRDTFIEAVDACVGDGAAWTKFLFVNDMWNRRYGLKVDQFGGYGNPDSVKKFDKETEKAKRDAGPPFVWQNVDNLTFFPVWTGGKVTEGLEVTKRPINETFETYGLNLATNGDVVARQIGEPFNEREALRLGNTCTFLEYWNSEWCVYAVLAGPGKTGRVVKSFRHGYNRVPYFYAPGYTFNWMFGRKAGWSLCEAMRWLVEYRSYLYTLEAQVAARDSFVPLFHERPAGAEELFGEDQEPDSEEEWELRHVYEGSPGEKLTPVQFPPVADSLKEQIAIVTQAIDDMRAPRVSTQQLGGGMEGAGFAINQVLAEAKISQNHFVMHMQRMLYDITNFMWYLIREVVKEKVWVFSSSNLKDQSGRWLVLGPQDVQTNVGMYWELDPERPAAKLLETRLVHERKKEGTLDEGGAIVALGDNPDEVRLGKALDRIRASQWYTMMQDQAVTQKMGKGDLIRKAAALAAQSGGLPTKSGGLVNPGGGLPQNGAMDGRNVPDMGNLAAAPGGLPASPEGGSIPNQSAAAQNNVPPVALSAGV